MEIIRQTEACVLSVVCLGSHRVGISNPNSAPGIPQNLRTCVQGDLALVSRVKRCLLVLVVPVWSVCLICGVFQRSVTSVCRCRVTRRVTSAAWTVRAPSTVCVNRDGGVSDVSRVR